MNRRLFLAAAALVAGTYSAHAQQGSPVQVTGVWARATPGGATTGAVYMTLLSPAGDTLTSASSPEAQHAGVHEMHMDGTVMRMRPVQGGLDLPAGKAVTLAPGGYHVMLEGLKAPLRVGQSLPVHLTFGKSPPMDVTAAVRPIGASGPGMTMGK